MHNNNYYHCEHGDHAGGQCTCAQRSSSASSASASEESTPSEEDGESFSGPGENGENGAESENGDDAHLCHLARTPAEVGPAAGHDHASGHNHGPGHVHGAGAQRGRIAWALGITFSILIAEVIGAFWLGSLALLVDAGHMLTDSAGLVMALVAAHLTTKPATNRRTWGYARAEIISACLQATLLLGVGIFVIIEAIKRLTDPPEMPAAPLLIFGIIGLLGNIASMLILFTGRGASLNMKAAFLEVCNDALGSVAVIVAAASIYFTGWGGADAIAAILIGILIIPRALRILSTALNVLMEATPQGLDLDEVRQHMENLPHVIRVHDMHATTVATGLPVLSAHVVVEDECFFDGHAPRILDQLQQCVAEHFPVKVEHSTFQLEPAEHSKCEYVPHG
ncbi:cation diffusion facilitator family transporter [Actinotignum schaalii]|uniref:cation diffusion facilitator family transporter n=1 Tax=Actinotignum TaxID=1653174 RepID=UPI000426F9C7|nr:cation diffusion facilitator family transporter [Actinotignum schaalii]WQN45222.1 cation diffusion facilitator family transporter [Actinotignum schaalii]